MNTFLSPPSFRIHAFVLAGALTAFLACSGCGHKTAGPSASVKPVSASRNPLAIALATHVGTDRMDEEIRRCQERVRAGDAAPGTLERLGWLYVGKARSACDPGFYLLAEQCAFALEEREPGSSAALLLRGHTLQSRHRFTEAEPVARTLVARRGLSFDHGLLGDILVDLGRVEEAAAAYQSMMDLKPDPQGYARVANIRWLRGDLEGALEAIRVAAWGASPSDPESAAWLNTQLARLLWQSGNAGAASGALNIALGFHPGHAAALLLRGRMLLASGETEKAVETLREAARLNPLPEAQWALAEALRATHREEQAGEVERLIESRGPLTDPRTCSLFLATRRVGGDLAVRLARRELAERADVFTHDALAWALAAAGQLAEAQAELGLALSLQTQDARLYLHAASITLRAGRADEAAGWFDRAMAFKEQLLPGERAELETLENTLPARAGGRVAAAGAVADPSISLSAGKGGEAEN